MRQQTGSRNRGWLPAIRRRLESYGGHVGNRLSAAAGVALAAGMMAGTVQGAWPAYLATGGDRTMWTNFTGTATQIVYGIHSYTNAGVATNFVPSADLPKVEFLVIGGGGGGGHSVHSGAPYEGGGGGAGGYICSVQGELSGSNSYAGSTTSLTANVSVPVSVGGGGATIGGKGTNSSFGSIVALGGGGGSSGSAGVTGGSGGGGGGSSGTKGAGTALQGWQGGSGDGSGYGAGGGGGAGQVGQAGTTPSGGSGGSGGTGLWSRITGEWIQRGGGGGGGGWGVGGGGGDGGGGRGANNSGGTSLPGTDGFGGGGGGGGGGGSESRGGSGIVIVRYEIPVVQIKGTVIMMR